jgi:hypothetical protein
VYHFAVEHLTLDSIPSVIVRCFHMPKRSGKQDVNEKAFSIVQKLTGLAPEGESEREKNPAAVALGRLGGLKGGKARASRLTTKQRRAAAQKAAKARWAKRPAN